MDATGFADSATHVETFESPTAKRNTTFFYRIMVFKMKQ